MPFLPPESFNMAHYFLDARLEEGLGENEAILTEERSYTYREVKERADSLAAHLQSLGLAPEQRVILAAQDGIGFVSGLFAILKAGGVVVMINPALPESEIRYFFEYSRAPLALVDEPARFAPLAANSTIVDLENLQLKPVPDRENFSTHRDDPAMWIFSGGTTGKPKAAVQSHRSFPNTCECYAKNFLGYSAQERTMAIPKLFFGYATGSNLFFPFSVGGSCCLFRDHPTPELLFQKISHFRPTLLVNVPKMIHKMVDHHQAGQADLSSLRVVTSAGEALPPTLYQRWNDTFQVELVDGLGTAEMWHIFLSNRPGAVKPGTLGRAVPGFEVKVADDDGRALPVGEIGRLWVRGGSRALCYWQRSEQSEEAFRGPWFASGDRVRQDEDGFIHYCGRGDDMMKVGGKWLAPLELEDCLLRHPAVKECAVVAHIDKHGLTQPLAFVVSDQPAEELGAALKDHALNHLEAYKHPRRIVFVESMPRTHLGKIDRSRLKELV